ncbi:MAG: DUF1015 domain-containing protein [Gemmatimonadetes bacterium]|nr:DUF1015 domain-containing protein [Gemmatimonadota bacterium]
MTSVERAALVSAFSGERYADLESLSDLIAPPYDVISPAERKSYQTRHRNNIVSLTLPEGENRYETAAETLATWREEGVLVRETEVCVYVLRQTFTPPAGSPTARAGRAGRVGRVGLLAAIAVEGYESGRVLPHERTHAHIKEDRLALMRATGAMFESLLFMAPDASGKLKSLIADEVGRQPLARAQLGDVTNELWRVSGPNAQAMCEAAETSSIYIADGHHRYETASAYRLENSKADRTLGLIVPTGDPGLVVLPTHRMISGDEVGQGELGSAVDSAFDIEEMTEDTDVDIFLEHCNSDETACVLVLPAKTMLLRLKRGLSMADMMPSVSPVVSGLGVARIDHLVVNEICRIAGSGSEVSYSPSSAAVRDAVGSGDCVAGVLLSATSVEDVIAVADAREFMPQKATFFSPKVPSGLVMLGFDSES